MKSVDEILKDSTVILRLAEIAEPRRQACSLLAFALQKNQTFLIAHSDYQLTEAELKYFDGLLSRRAQREPFQHITGVQEFYGLEYIVTPDVLIPRPETEMIVENAIEILSTKPNSRICELGVGSGCISISILHEIKTVSGVGLDISEKALLISAKNAAKHLVVERLDLKRSDIFDQLKQEKFDMIVSNPPYIPASDVADLQAEVRDFEPLNALTDGGNGLSIVEKIIVQSPQFLGSAGYLLMEIGIHQSDKVKKMFKNKIWQKVDILPDLQGIPRMIKARIL